MMPRLSFVLSPWILLPTALLLPLLAEGAAPAELRAEAPPERLLDTDESPLEEAERRLEYAPDDVDLLEQASRAALSAADSDRAYWYGILGLELASQDKRARKQQTAFEEILAQVDPPQIGADQLMDAYAKELFGLAQTFQRRKLYANAVDVLVRCRGTRYEREAQKKLDKIYSDTKAVEQLIASGIEIPEQPTTRKGPEEIAKEDAKHEEWEDSYEFKGKFYTVITNTGLELGTLIFQAMNQMNDLYRQVYQYKTRGGTMRRAVIQVYGTREEFEHHESEYVDSPSIQGFLLPSENRIATFDPRTRGGSLTDLWETLFHEASHQFLRAVMPGTVPAWFNEGTACYFEGARLLPSGFVQTNLIASSRLESLLALMEIGRPSLKEVVSYFQPGSYPGEYYPFGWGLIYFIQNYENEKSERVYLPIYSDYVATYKSGGNHDVVGRFVEYFVDKVAVPGVGTFEEFEAHWKQWIHDLAALEHGGSEKADFLIQRARTQLANGKREYAADSYKWALRKRPGDPVALLELAQLQLELGLEDSAIFNLRRILSLARGQVDPEKPAAGFEDKTWKALGEQAVALLTEVDRHVGAGSAEAGEVFAQGILAAADKLAEADLPLGAMHLLSDANSVLGGDGRLSVRIEELATESGRSVERWRRLGIDDDLELWEGAKVFDAAPPTSIRVDSDTIATTVYRADMPARYRYEGTFELSGKGDMPAFGLAFGANNQTGMRIFALLPAARSAGVFELKGGPKEIHDLAAVRDAEAESLSFAIEVDGTQASFFLNGQDLGTRTLEPGEVVGRVGLLAQDIEATVTDLRVRY